MLDMDNFKAVNDNYGHIAGDETLKIFAGTLKKFAGEGDVLCRIGGDEFMIFVKDVTKKVNWAAVQQRLFPVFKRNLLNLILKPSVPFRLALRRHRKTEWNLINFTTQQIKRYTM